MTPSNPPSRSTASIQDPFSLSLTSPSHLDALYSPKLAPSLSLYFYMTLF